MKKTLIAAAFVAVTSLAACSSTGLDVNTIIADTQAACSFTPAVSSVIALINAQTGGSTATSVATTAVEVAQSICTAVNNINTTSTTGTQLKAGTEISVVVETPSGPVTVSGTINKK